MSFFKESDPERMLKLLEGHENVLAPLVAKEEAFFRSSTCPSCNGRNLEAFLHPSNPFAPGSPLPSKLLRCLQCKTEFDPYTRLVTRVTSDSEESELLERDLSDLMRRSQG